MQNHYNLIAQLGPASRPPIIGASKMYQLKEAIAALDIRLDADDTQWLEATYTPHALPGHA